MTSPHAVALLAFLASLASVQTVAAKQAEQTFAGKTEVISVEVPVNVVDQRGQPIGGLGIEHFELLDDGLPRPIESVEVIDLATLDPADPFAARRAARRLPAASRRHFLLLFDLAFSSPQAIARARQAARELALSSLHPTDLAAVAVYSRKRGLELLVTFSLDRVQLVRAIDNLGAPRQLARARDPLHFLIEEPSNITPLMAGNRGDSTLSSSEEFTDSLLISKQLRQSDKAFERARISGWASALGKMARILASVEGRKHILYFSEGFDGRLLLGREADAQDPQVELDKELTHRGLHGLVDNDDIYGNGTLKNDIESMLEQLRRADCVLQAIDIGGLKAGSAAATRIDRTGQDALFYIAHGTGGELFEDTNQLGPQLERALNRSRLTYLLTFRADDLPKDGSYHRLQVKVAGHKGRISHRAGYYGPQPFAELHPLEKSLLAAEVIASAEPRREITLDLLATPFRTGSNIAYVPVIIEADGEDLLRDHGGELLAIEIYVYVTDSDGTLRDLFSQVVKIALENAREHLGKGLKFYGHLELGAGNYLLRTLVRNAETGRAGARSLSLVVPDFTDGTVRILPPLFPEPLDSWMLVRENAAGTGTDQVVYPFTFAGKLFVPAARPRLNSGPTALYLIGYELAAGPLIFTGQVLDSSGKIVDQPRLELIERTATAIDGIDKFHLELELGTLPTGDYSLRVEVSDNTTATLIRSVALFRTQLLHPTQ